MQKGGQRAARNSSLSSQSSSDVANTNARRFDLLRNEEGFVTNIDDGVAMDALLVPQSDSRQLALLALMRREPADPPNAPRITRGVHASGGPTIQSRSSLLSLRQSPTSSSSTTHHRLRRGKMTGFAHCIYSIHGGKSKSGAGQKGPNVGAYLPPPILRP